MNNNECENDLVSTWNDVYRVSRKIICDSIFSVCLNIGDVWKDVS